MNEYQLYLTTYQIDYILLYGQNLLYWKLLFAFQAICLTFQKDCNFRLFRLRSNHYSGGKS